MTIHEAEAAVAPAPDPAVELGAAINNLLFRHRITHTAMGEAIGVGQSTMSKKLRGQVGITMSELLVIADVLGVRAVDLVDQVERACRDSNPKPSDLCPTGVIDLDAERAARRQPAVDGESARIWWPDAGTRPAPSSPSGRALRVVS